jgi:hypothetical protein
MYFKYRDSNIGQINTLSLMNENALFKIHLLCSICYPLLHISVWSKLCNAHYSAITVRKNVLLRNWAKPFELKQDSKIWF